MSIQCPYDKLTLKVAILSAGPKLEKISDEKIEEWGKTQRADMSKDAIAKFHGITVKDLINSPNYEILKSEYEASAVENALEFFRTEIGLDHKEAWAILMMGTNHI